MDVMTNATGQWEHIFSQQCIIDRICKAESNWTWGAHIYQPSVCFNVFLISYSISAQLVGQGTNNSIWETSLYSCTYTTFIMYDNSMIS